MKCKSCQIEKPAMDFYVSNKTRCRECVCANVRKNRLEKIDYYRSYDKVRASMPHRVAARAEYINTPAGRAAHRRATDKWDAFNKKRKSAQTAVGNAVRDGRLLKHPCWVCGAKAQAHHPDYDAPLDVVWLCPAHHKQAHALVANAPDMREAA